MQGEQHRNAAVELTKKENFYIHITFRLFAVGEMRTQVTEGHQK